MKTDENGMTTFSFSSVFSFTGNCISYVFPMNEQHCISLQKQV